MKFVHRVQIVYHPRVIHKLLADRLPYRGTHGVIEDKTPESRGRPPRRRSGLRDQAGAESGAPGKSEDPV